MNQAWNKAPKITNPTARPGLCKHILALRNWIDNSLDVLTSEHEDDGSALKQLVAYAQHRHSNEKEIMAAAKAGDYKSVLAMLRKRKGEPGPLDKAAGKTPEAGVGEPELELGEPAPELGQKPETAPETEPPRVGPLVSPVDSPNPLDFHGRLPLPTEPEAEPEEPDKKRPQRAAESQDMYLMLQTNNTVMNLIEAQRLVKEMMDASPAAQPSLGTATGSGAGCASCQTPGGVSGVGGEGEVSAESEALNLLRNISAGIQELVPAVQALSQGQGGLNGPGDMDGVDFPEPGGEDEFGGEGEGEFDTADRFDIGSEDRGGEFGDLTGGPEEFGDEGEGEEEESGFGRGRGGGSASRERGGGSASRERERPSRGRKKNLTVSGEED
jgi:hypothetical protein